MSTDTGPVDALDESFAFQFGQAASQALRRILETDRRGLSRQPFLCHRLTGGVEDHERVELWRAVCHILLSAWCRYMAAIVVAVAHPVSHLRPKWMWWIFAVAAHAGSVVYGLRHHPQWARVPRLRMMSLSAFSVLVVSCFRVLAKMSPGPGDSWVTVVAYPAVRPAVSTAVHHSVFMVHLLAAFFVDVAECVLVHGGGFPSRFFWGPIVFQERVSGGVGPDCLAEVEVPSVEDAECGFVVGCGGRVVVEDFTYVFGEEFSHVVHVEFVVFEEFDDVLFFGVAGVHHCDGSFRYLSMISAAV